MQYASIILLALVFIPLERMQPRYPEQKTFRRNWVTDVMHLLFNGFLVRGGFALLIGSAVVAYRSAVGADASAWVRDLPMVVQLIGVIIVGDIGYYIAHRSSHAIPFLWKFHAVHHSSEEMDWLASNRLHPIDQIYASTWQMLPIFFAGFSTGAVAIYVLIYKIHSLLQHSNVRVNFGPFKWVFCSPDFHHWHHANQREAYDKNFASQLPIIDLIAGTHFLPDRDPDKYGLREDMPDHYHQQLLHPFLQILDGWKQRGKQKGKTDEQEA